MEIGTNIIRREKISKKLSAFARVKPLVVHGSPIGRLEWRSGPKSDLMSHSLRKNLCYRFHLQVKGIPRIFTLKKWFYADCFSRARRQYIFVASVICGFLKRNSQTTDAQMYEFHYTFHSHLAYKSPKLQQRRNRFLYAALVNVSMLQELRFLALLAA